VNTPEEARAFFLARGHDARALCFAALLSSPLDKPRLRRSAELGFAFAQAFVQSEQKHKKRDSLWLRKHLCRGSGMVFVCLDLAIERV